MLGCGDDTGPTGPPPAGTSTSSGGAGTGGGGSSAECEDGDTRECTVDLGVHNGVHSCLVGVQECVDGEWDVCVAGGAGGAGGA